MQMRHDPWQFQTHIISLFQRERAVVPLQHGRQSREPHRAEPVRQESTDRHHLSDEAFLFSEFRVERVDLPDNAWDGHGMLVESDEFAENLRRRSRGKNRVD
jgi:hypothetical protein